MTEENVGRYVVVEEIGIQLRTDLTSHRATCLHAIVTRLTTQETCVQVQVE